MGVCGKRLSRDLQDSRQIGRPRATATPPWGVQIGQSLVDQCPCQSEGAGIGFGLAGESEFGNLEEASEAVYPHSRPAIFGAYPKASFRNTFWPHFI